MQLVTGSLAQQAQRKDKNLRQSASQTGKTLKIFEPILDRSHKDRVPRRVRKRMRVPRNKLMLNARTCRQVFCGMRLWNDFVIFGFDDEYLASVYLPRILKLSNCSEISLGTDRALLSLGESTSRARDGAHKTNRLTERTAVARAARYAP